MPFKAAVNFAGISLLFGALLPIGFAQQKMPASAPQTNSSYIDAQGTAHVTRIVPVPRTVSPQAQHLLARQIPDVPNHASVAEDRKAVDGWQAGMAKLWQKAYPANVENSTMAGLPVRIITPPEIPAINRNRVLLNVHGGGFIVDSGSLAETIPIAHMAQTKVVAVLYRLAPEHPYPAAVDDAVAVYKELLKTYKPENIAIYGTSAGAVLTAEVAVRLQQLGLPLPGALGIFSGVGDFSKAGDSQSIFSLHGLAGHHGTPPGKLPDWQITYMGSANPNDPVLSPVYANLKGFPPTLFVTSERDMLLSGTTILHRAFLRAGADARLVVFEGLPHAFWEDPRLPESIEANHIMARFFDEHLGK